MDFICDSNYIVFPVSHNARCKKLKFFANSKMIFDLDIAIDYYNFDYYAYYDVTRFKNINISVECEPNMSFEIMKAEFVNTDKQYTEKYRPTIHFTAQTGWINDPNGLVYYDGKYHLFYQYNPVGCIWNNMHWGHAVSENLVEWSHKDIALYPDEKGTMFSGSAIIDKKNLLGVKNSDDDTIILFYTAAGGTSKMSEDVDFTQCIAYSTDGGKTFQKYIGNPVVKNITKDNRDPKVIYHKQTDRYIMALYLNDNKFALLYSKNLLDWTQIQEISLEGDAECPDFYPLRLDADEKWVFSGASDKYIIGSFDGYTFKQETEVKRLHHGDNCYASQTWSDVNDGRRIRIAWNRYEIPKMNFNKSMTFPCDMSIRTTTNGIKLCTYPVKEVENLYLSQKEYDEILLEKESSVPLSGKSYDIMFELLYKDNSIIDVDIFGMKINFDTKMKRIKCNDIFAPIHSMDKTIKARMLVDVIGIELFVNDGSVYVVNGQIADYNLNRLEFKSDSKDIIVKNLKIAELKNIWRRLI